MSYEEDALATGVHVPTLDAYLHERGWIDALAVMSSDLTAQQWASRIGVEVHLIRQACQALGVRTRDQPEKC